MFIINNDNFSTYVQDILNDYYLQPLAGARKAKPQDGYLERPVHGAMHATRATVWALLMQAVLAEITPDYVNISLEKIAAFTGEDVNTVKLIMLLTMLCHDIARKGEGQDAWEKQSSDVTFELLKKFGLEDKNARLFANAIVFKDKRNDYCRALTELGVSEQDINAFDYIRKIINLGDNLDILRCVGTFDANFIFNTLSTVDGYDPAKHDQIIMQLIIAIHEFIYNQGDMLFACEVKNRAREIVAEHQSHISSHKKIMREHADNVFDVMLAEASVHPLFQPYLTFLIAKPTSHYAGELAFDPYIHGTNSSIFSVLQKTNFQIMSPMEMLDDYQVAPMTGELTEGGFSRVGSAAIKDEREHGKTSFAKMSANGNCNAYTLEKVINNYAALREDSQNNNHLAFFKKELERGLSLAFSNINLLAIYFVRARLTHDTLVKIMTQDELKSLAINLDATVQFFYFIQLLGIHIHPNFEALDAQPNRSLLTEAVRHVFTFEHIVSQIIKHNIDMKTIVENPTEQNLEKALVVLELPERIVFKHYNLDLEGYRKKNILEPTIRQLFCLTPNYTSTGRELEPVYTFGRLSENKIQGYLINDVLYRALRKEIEPEKFFRKFTTLPKKHIVALNDRIRLFFKLFETPQDAFALSALEKAFLKNRFPVILIAENDGKMILANFTHQEFRGTAPLRLGTDITMIATKSEGIRLFVMKYLALMGFKHIEVVLFDDLQKSKLSKKRPRNPYQHHNGVAKLQWLCAQQAEKHLPQYTTHYTISPDIDSVYSEKNVLACMGLMNSAVCYKHITLTGNMPAISYTDVSNFMRGYIHKPVPPKTRTEAVAEVQTEFVNNTLAKSETVNTATQHASTIVSPSSKLAILQDLNNFLNTPNLTKEMILDRFDQLKQKNGLYKALHAQRNPHFDRFRLFFKRNVNAGEHYFWHTQSYQTAVKLLKNAYVKIDAKINADDAARENAFIDYVRGNALMHHRRTSTRKLLLK